MSANRRPSRGDTAAGDYGMGNPYATMCHLCDEQIRHPRDATKRGSHWIHKTCAGGADDEQGNPQVRQSSEVPRSEWWAND